MIRDKGDANLIFGSKGRRTLHVRNSYKQHSSILQLKYLDLNQSGLEEFDEQIYPYIEHDNI